MSSSVVPICPEDPSLLNPLEKGCRVRVAAGSVGLLYPRGQCPAPGSPDRQTGLRALPAPQLQIGRSLANEGEIGFYGNCGAVRAAANSTDYLGYVQQHALLCHCVNMCL